MMSDIIPLEFYITAKKKHEKQRQTLRPFLFNMQNHLVEKVSKLMEDIMSHIETKSKDNDAKV